jgi:hypothetical protein
MPITGRRPMPELPEWPPTTLRDALTAAREALADRTDASLAEDEVGRALLDAADRETGAFLDAEPYRLVLDPVPAGRSDDPFGAAHVG